VIAALAAARELGLATIGLTGAGGGAMRDVVDICIEVSSAATPRIQEVHTVVAHILCELIERDLG
jgi:D-sedoheptulose 7-phosphate isomerase